LPDGYANHVLDVAYWSICSARWKEVALDAASFG
jgi:hypothetical protein